MVFRGEIYWVASEEGGPAHPHVVVQEDVFNHSRIHTVIVCALTSNLHRANEPGNVLLDEDEAKLPERSVVLVSQIDSIPKSRLGERIGSLSQDRVEQILSGLRFQQRAFSGIGGRRQRPSGRPRPGEKISRRDRDGLGDQR